MRAKMLLLSCVLVIPLFSGCFCTQIRKDYARGAEIYMKQILPPYKDYIDKDTALDPDSKRIRKQTADEFQRYIEEGQK